MFVTSRRFVHTCTLSHSRLGSSNLFWTCDNTWQVHETSARDKCTWPVHVKRTRDKYTWQAHMTSTCDKHTWQAHVTSTRDKYTWQAHVTSTRDKHTWQAHVTSTRDKYTWDEGIFRWRSRPACNYAFYSHTQIYIYIHMYAIMHFFNIHKYIHTYIWYTWTERAHWSPWAGPLWACSRCSHSKAPQASRLFEKARSPWTQRERRLR
jgi:hypothetical protein